MCDYNSEKLYSKVRELRAKRDQLDPITFEQWIHELIVIGCMTEVCSKRSVTGLTRKRVPRGLSGHRYPSSLYEPRNVSLEDAMRV